MNVADQIRAYAARAANGPHWQGFQRQLEAWAVEFEADGAPSETGDGQ